MPSTIIAAGAVAVAVAGSVAGSVVALLQPSNGMLQLHVAHTATNRERKRANESERESESGRAKAFSIFMRAGVVNTVWIYTEHNLVQTTNMI